MFEIHKHSLISDVVNACNRRLTLFVIKTDYKVYSRTISVQM